MTPLEHEWPQNGSLMLFNPSRASPTSVRSSGPSPRSSTPSAGSSTSSARWWHQEPSLWAHGPCQPGIRCFKKQTHSIWDPRHCKVQTHSVRGQGTTCGTWWHQWHPVGPLQVHVGINDNFINRVHLNRWLEHFDLLILATHLKSGYDFGSLILIKGGSFSL